MNNKRAGAGRQIQRTTGTTIPALEKTVRLMRENPGRSGCKLRLAVGEEDNNAVYMEELRTRNDKNSPQ